MKEKAECYPYYERILKMKLEQSVTETTEYKVLAEHYPHLAESIRLKRKIERLKEKLISEKERSSRFQIKREINVTKTKLKQENMLKRLRGESKQETIFRTHFIINASKEHIYSLAMKSMHACTSAPKKLRRLMSPSVVDLKSLDTTEKGLALREWVQDHHKKRR
jgi:hypothetical protein